MKHLYFKNSENIDADVRALYSSPNYVIDSIEVNPYVNSSQSRTFTKNDCVAFGVVSTAGLTVPAGTYFSYYSQAYADEKTIATGQAVTNKKWHLQLIFYNNPFTIQKLTGFLLLKSCFYQLHSIQFVTL